MNQGSKFTQISESARMIQLSCAERQNALISLVLIAEYHQIPRQELVSRFADALPRTPLEGRRNTRKFFWSRVKAFARRWGMSSNLKESVEADKRLLPSPVLGWLATLNDRERLRKLYSIWMGRLPDSKYRMFAGKEGASHQLLIIAWMVLKLLFLGSLILLFILPQLLELGDELGIDIQRNWALLSVRFTAELIVQFWFVFLLLVLVILFLWRRKMFGSLNPFTWQKTQLSQTSLDRVGLAILAGNAQPNAVENPDASAGVEGLERFEGLVDRDAGEFDWSEACARKIISPTEQRALETCQDFGVQAWILGQLVNRRTVSSVRLSKFWTSVLLNLAYLTVAFFICGLVVGIFSFLISMMDQLLPGGR